MNVTPLSTSGPATFSEAFGALRRAQKDSRGSPVYSRFINRPVGRLFAAAAYRLGLTPNQVTLLSGVSTFVGIGLIALLPPTWLTGLMVAAALIIGYALDSADGQLARLRGSGSALGEWLDHMVDAAKLATIHLAVLISMYRYFNLQRSYLLAVPIAFAAIQSTHFFGMILTDLVTREHHSRVAAPITGKGLKPSGVRSTVFTLARSPVDYGLTCLTFLWLGANAVFLITYTVMLLAWAAYLLTSIVRWQKLIRSLS